MNYKQSKDILEKINKANSILLNCHVSPDADSVSSALAMYQVLKDMGKKIKIVCPNELPEDLSFLPLSDKVEETDFSSFDYSKFDLFIIMDTPTWYRVTGEHGLSMPEKLEFIKIDHHSPDDNFGSLEIVDTKSSANCEMLFRIFHDWEISIDKNLATILLAGLLADTGSFQFEVSSDTLRIGADLVDLGADIAGIKLNLFKSMNFEGAKYLAALYSHIKKDENYGFIWSALSYDEGGKYAGSIDTFLFDVFLQSTRDTHFGVRIVEIDKGKIRIGFRSRSGYDTAEIARLFNGGGHSYAAGAYVESSDFDRKLDEVLSRIRSYVKAHPFKSDE